MVTTNQAFEQFVSDISATDYQRNTLVPARKASVESNLIETFPSTSNLPFSGADLIGSASKGTIIRPISDVDVLALFDNRDNIFEQYRHDSQAFIYRIRNAYSGVSTAQVGTRGQAVRVFFQSGGHVDVAPVFSGGDGVYLLPDGSGGWLSTAPFVANTWFAARQRELNYRLVTMVRLLKKWNKAHSSRLKSFHLETMAATLFGSLSTRPQDGLQVFFQYAGSCLDVTDPGQQSGSLASGLSWSQREAILNSFRTAAARCDLALTAEREDRHDDAKRHWAIILGGDFPTK